MDSPDSSEDMMCGMSDSTVTSMGGMKKDKLCLVCGDKALGYNFNAVSCESCKAFFRRNAHKTIRGRCEGKCDVTVESRSFCKRCRLAKCFIVGMRRDMILNDEQKKVRKQKIIYNKLRRQGQMPPQDTYSASPKDLLPTPIATSTFMTVNSRDPKVKVKKESAPSPQPLSNSSPGEGATISYSPWVDSQEFVDNAIRQLVPEQQSLLMELQFAMEETAFLAQTSTSLKSLPTNPTEFINVAEGFVRKVIKLARHISSFKSLHKDDQIALLKGSVVDIMMLRSAVNFDPQTETWNLSTGDCLKCKTSTDISETGPGIGNPGLSCTSPRLSLGSPGLPSFPGGSPGASIGSVGSLGVSQGSPRMGGRSPGMGAESPDMSAGNPLRSSGGMAAAFSGGSEGEGFSHSRISAELLKRGSTETLVLYMTYSKFIKSLMSSIQGDLLILKILIMMSLFSPDRSTLEERDKVQQVQEDYATVLQMYAGLRFPEDKTLFARLVMKLTDLRNINEVHSKMLLKMKIDDMEPLLLEVFDLPS